MSFKYQVLDTLDHDGQRFERGELIELEDAQAANLARIGVVSATPAEMAASGLTVSGFDNLTVSGGSSSRSARKARDKPATEAGKDQAPDNADESPAIPGTGGDASEADGGDTGAKE